MTSQNKIRGRRLFALLICSALLFGALSVTALALDTEKACSLALHYGYDKSVFEQNGVKLFRVAEVSADGTYTMTGAFAAYRVKVNGVSTQTEWKETAATLSSYTAADSVTPDRDGKTDKDGVIRFADLKTGLYLVVSDTVETAAASYIFAPFMISLPNIGEDGNWVYDVSANPKCEAHTVTPAEIEHKVVKLWNDADCTIYRPESITVDILKNGEKVSEQVLSEQNNWSYAWTSPDDGSVWQAVERDVNEHYTVTVREENNIITITNTTTENGDKPEPPHTGDTNHTQAYVLLMAVSGMALLLVGMTKLRRDANAEK